MLSGDARNVCDHGVVCPLAKRREEGSPAAKRSRKSKQAYQANGRESLNLRFGLHGSRPGQQFFVGDEMPSFILPIW